MRFRHAPEIWADHPTLAAGVLSVDGVSDRAAPDDAVDRYLERAQELLAAGPASALPQLQAWRRTFAAMGVKPTQYRCASESLLRRLGKDGTLPRIHPLVDLCNAASAAAAIPVAALDRDRVKGDLEVCRAQGDETYASFGGEVERPVPGEVIFADEAGQAHARRWTHKQSGTSIVRPETRDVLIVSEALHPGAAADVEALLTALAADLTRAWPGVTPRLTILTPERPVAELAG
ncbi:B3/B4 domain-containing protein [Jiangella alkaliphila]|uniref:B3/B4 domain-containing protein (DNA/RNA-binding domain of Phe-tRNA-synthetase) n=1 Tax=Jiangella alkaliphila TaxID=419479 RepID=A0A1H2K1H8_9ACTN|nr:phenylalanine--tRNA ligase beta subunit-related protein [Jiangella alkaliphila]SDU62268.1 B3/B4 domain-containing protein (DNA/RNA-binding domain of Phe-tRNA-synthetase) [Jiangella alkaliphila]